MKILLLNLADLVDEKGQPKKYIIPQISVPPLGLLYMGQILSDNGYSVKVYDQTVTAESNIDVMKIIKKINPDVVGFSVLIDNFWTTINLFKKLKNWNSNVITIAGNYFATFYPERLMDKINFDFCIRGEGEYSLLNLINTLSKKKNNFHEIRGLTYRENNVIKSTADQERIKNLDELPIPDRKMIDFNYKLQEKSTSIVSSRGCPYSCRFCSFSAVMGKVWRPRSAKNIIEEIQLLKEQGYKEILFVDDNFTLNKKRIFRLCAEIKRNHLDTLLYSGDCRIDNVSYNLIRGLVSANFRQICFGIESANQRILDYYQKDIKVNQINQAIKTAKKARMQLIYGSFVLGAPDETFAEAANTIKFANKLDLSFLVFQILYTNPISSIYKELVDKGLHIPKDDDWQKVFKVPEICPTAIPINLLRRLINEGFVRFFNRRRITNYIFDSLKNRYYIDSMINSLQNLRRGAV